MTKTNDESCHWSDL